MTQPIDHILVLGGGTAGLLAGVTARVKLPDVRVTVLRSTEIGVIGVGEGTTASFPSFLHGYLRIDPADFVRLAGPTFELGTQFDQQVTGLPKPVGYYAAGSDATPDGLSLGTALVAAGRASERRSDGRPAVRGDVAFHVENAAVVHYPERLAAFVGGDAASLACPSGSRRSADLYVDCAGFASTLLGASLNEPPVCFAPGLLCDRAVVGGWDRPAGDVPDPVVDPGPAFQSGEVGRRPHERFGP